VESLCIAFDGDESGRKASETIALRLASEGFNVHQVKLPEGEDINHFFSLTADAKGKFLELL